MFPKEDMLLPADFHRSDHKFVSASVRVVKQQKAPRSMKETLDRDYARFLEVEEQLRREQQGFGLRNKYKYFNY